MGLIQVKHEIDIDSLRSEKDFPKILELNRNAEPVGWMTYKNLITQKCKGNVVDVMGKYQITARGGWNARTGLRSTMTLDTIVIIDNTVSPHSYINHVPTLNNKALFERDHYMCAYCGKTFKFKQLSADHIVPQSKGGKDTWMNEVTACVPCNNAKGNLSLKEAGMELLYVPYVPSFCESLILENRVLLADQMEFLLRHVSEHSRLHKELTKH